MLHERELLRREFHDGLGQVLGFVKMQAQAARAQLAQDQKAVDSQLAQLAAVAQDGYTDIREYILGERTTWDSSAGFLKSLQNYLQSLASNLRFARISPAPGTGKMTY